MNTSHSDPLATRDSSDLTLPEPQVWDVTHTPGPVAHHWTSTNVGEAAPGVLTPLATSHWYEATNRAALQSMHNIGVLSAAENSIDRPAAEQVVRLQFGRITARLEFMTTLGDRLPGVTGASVLQSLLGEAPPTITYHPTRRRYPVVAIRMAWQVGTSRARLLRVCAETDAWWRQTIRSIPAMDEVGLVRTAREGVDRFERAFCAHLTALYSSVQPAYDGLQKLIDDAGTGDMAVLSGSGGAEMNVVTDLWRASRGEIGLDEVVRRHGFHGPSEGEVSSKVWRDDDAPLRSVLEHYRAMPEEQSPMNLEAQRSAQYEPMATAVLAAIPARRRLAARATLARARKRVPDRGVGKRAFLQGIDGTRAAARALGARWADAGLLDDADDIFFLTIAELEEPLPGDVRDLIDRRRARRIEFQGMEFRSLFWQGAPEMVAVRDLDGARLAAGSVISGTGVSAGVVEGRVRVVTDPSFEDVEPGEILVASTTDPSWCSIMFVSSGLVVDLGGALSHAAVVAREMGIPCIVNTGDGSHQLRSGDLVRIDGSAGTVTVLGQEGEE